VVLALLGGWLLLQRHGFWYDELYTAEMAPLPLGDLVNALVRGEGTIAYLRDAPPSYNAPYYATTHLWLAVTRLQPDEFGLRLLSLLSAVAAVAVFTAAVGRLAGRRVGALAGLVAATNPFVVLFSVEARGYSLALLATSLAALALVRWLDGGGHALLLYGTGAVAAGLAHWFALLPVAAFGLAGVALRGRQAAPLLAVAGLATLPALGLVALALANGVGASGAEWIPDVGLAAPWLAFRSWSGGQPALLGVTLVAAAAGTVMGGRPALVAAAWVGMPLVAVTLVGLVRPVFVDRYLLPALLGLAVLVALGLSRLPGRVGTAVVVGVLTVSLSASLTEMRRGPRDDMRRAVAAVAAEHRPAEPVVAAARWDALGLEHYARRDHAALLADLVLPHQPVPSAPAVWVVRKARGGVKGDGDKRAALEIQLKRRGMRPALEQRFRGRSGRVFVQRWETPAGVVHPARWAARPAN
jgi:mannosyltransferase